ncbi:MAG: hypothetical protein ABSG35_15075 [Syntrophobacteraceae bacterium]
MPLSKLQSEILRLLAAHRDPENYVRGSTPLTRNAPRYSEDIDVFHDREDRVTQAVQQDTAILQEHGFSLQWLRREFTFYSVLVCRNVSSDARNVSSDVKSDEATKLEWVVDSDFRFFPAVKASRARSSRMIDHPAVGLRATRSTSHSVVYTSIIRG